MTAEGEAGPGVAGAAERIADGIAHLEQAVAAFSEAAESAEADIVPLAIELLARTLPLCERDEESAWAWQRGLEHPDPAVATLQQITDRGLSRRHVVHVDAVERQIVALRGTNLEAGDRYPLLQ